jgi:hypothetical protein
MGMGRKECMHACMHFKQCSGVPSRRGLKEESPLFYTYPLAESGTETLINPWH